MFSWLSCDGLLLETEELFILIKIRTATMPTIVTQGIVIAIIVPADNPFLFFLMF